jgi:hypothetical protein
MPRKSGAKSPGRLTDILILGQKQIKQRLPTSASSTKISTKPASSATLSAPIPANSDGVKSASNLQAHQADKYQAHECDEDDAKEEKSHAAPPALTKYDNLSHLSNRRRSARRRGVGRAEVDLGAGLVRGPCDVDLQPLALIPCDGR